MMADRSSLIETLRQRVDILDIIGSATTLKKTGKGYLGLCPFHQEKTPSFHVYPDQKRFYCYGCHKSGDSFAFLQDYRQMSFGATLEFLAQKYHLEYMLNVMHPQKNEEKEDRQRLQNLLNKATAYFHNQLLSLDLHHPAQKMIQQRGLKKEILLRYQLGWADGFENLPEILSASHKDLVECGLLVQDDRSHYRQRFFKRILFPIRTTYHHHTVGYGGRLVESGSSTYPKYLNSSENIFFKKSRLLYGLDVALEEKQFKSFVVVEGYFDVLQMANFGIFCAVAPMGTAIGQEHLEVLLPYHREIIFCFDGDQAGQKAAFKALTLALPFYDHKKSFSFVIMPKDHDPDSYLREIGRESFVNLFQKRVKIGEYLFRYLEELYPAQDVDSVVRFASEAKNLIRTVENTDARMTLLRLLDEHLRNFRYRKESWKKKTVPATLKKCSVHDWIFALLCLRPDLIDSLSEKDKQKLIQEDPSGQFLLLFSSKKEEESAVLRAGIKQQYKDLLDLMPLEAVDLELSEQLKKLGLTPNILSK